MVPQENQHDDVSRGTYAALHSLLAAVAHSVSARRICLISPPDQAECVLLAASDRPELIEQMPFEVGERDVPVDVPHGERVLGQLVVVEPGAEVSLPQLGAFASAAGYIMAYAGRLSEVEQLSRETRVLQELGLQLGEQSELTNILMNTVRSARAVLAADYASITTVADDGTTKWLAVDGYRTEAYKHTVVGPGQGTAARVMAAGKPLTLEGIGTSPDLPAEMFPVHAAEGGVSCLGVPLMWGGKPVGVLTLGSRRARQWREGEIRLASVVANGAAMALEQARIMGLEKAQRGFLEKVLENFPGVLLVLEPPDFRVALINSRFTAMLPEPFRSGESSVGRTIRELATEWTEQSEALVAMMRQVIETGETISYEQYASQNPEMGTMYWNWSLVPVDGAGESGQRMVMIIAHDVTESVLARRTAQQAAQTARSRAEELETVIRHMADGLVIFDAEGHIVRINPAGEALLGRKIDLSDESQKYAMQLGLHNLAGELLTLPERPSFRALQGETVYGMPVLVKRPSGEEAILTVSTAPLTDSEGNISGAVSVYHDITKEKLAERLKDEFLSVVSHELRTPLSAIMGYSDLMLRGVHGGFNERQAKSLNAIRANADRLLSLINDLLDVSRLEAGSVSVDTVPVNVGDVLARTIAHIRILAVNAGVTIRNEVSQGTDYVVMAEEPKLLQIIENLLTNAIKFTPAGGSVTFRAAFSPHAPDDPRLVDGGEDAPEGGVPRSVVISVSDTGAGLEADQLSRIWDRFYQVDSSAKRRSGGAGLGLAIVRSLVDLHGGRVWVTSEGQDKGSTFSFSLPAAADQVWVSTSPTFSPDEWHVKRVRRTTPGAAAATVLVAEDDPDQREIICDMLELEGYQVVLATDGQEALQLASALHPSAIALDVILPRTDGWEVLNRLKSDPETQDIPVLIISVVDQQEFGRKLGADEYLIKPLEPASLRAVVRRLIRERASTGSEGGEKGGATTS